MCALALAASACVASNPDAGPTTPGTARPTGGQTRPAPGSSSPSKPGSGTRTTPGGTVPGTLPAQASYDDDGAIGRMARAYLRRSPATSLLVEVDWVTGREPSRSALDHLTTILRRELDKPAGISVQLGNRINDSRESWTVAGLIALERANRNAHSSGGRATMWFGYVGGAFAENGNALAVAFSASSSAIFRDRLDDATSSLVMEPEIERSVITHEAGHLLALVNIGYRSRYDHEDRQHPKHSNNPESVMYWAVEDISIRNVLHGGPPSDFDSMDRDDLAMLRGA